MSERQLAQLNIAKMRAVFPGFGVFLLLAATGCREGLFNDDSRGSHMRLILFCLAIFFVANPAIADDQDAIAITVFDYMNGWYYGDAAQMERSLHPDLAKRRPYADPDGRTRLEHMGAMRLVQMARAGIGTRTPADARVKEVVILDVYDDIASVKAIMHGWIDYLHLARVNGRWVIVNVLWDMTYDKE